MTPKLRFPDFTGDWQSARLGDFFTFKNGVNADKSMYGSGRKFINVMDVIADAPITHDAIIGSVEISDNEFAKNKVVYGDVLFQRSSETREEVGQSNIYIDQQPATFGGFVIRGHPKQIIDPHYFHALLKTAPVRKDMTSRSGGSTRYNIGQESLEAVPVCVAPSFAEQQKIAELLSVVDARVGLFRRRRAALERYKMEMMRRLFAKTLRFKRSDGTAFPDWQDKLLGDLVTLKSGGTPSKEVAEYWGGDIPWISASSMHNDVISDSDLCVTELGAKSGTRVAAKGSLLLLVRGSMLYNRVPAGICARDVTFNQDVKALDPKPGVSATFILCQLRALEHRLLSLVVGTGIGAGKLDTEELIKFPMPAPHPDEQRKIADFLSVLDVKIADVSAKVNAMRTFKRGLLQQMFV